MNSSEQRFLLILGGATVVLAGGLAYWGLRGAARYNEASDRHESAASEVLRLERLDPYPSTENRNAKEKALKDYRESLAEVQQQFLKFRPEKIEAVESAEFGARLLEITNQSKDLLSAAGVTFPAEFALGFERYIEQQARRGATGLLGYQLDAIGELFGLLAAAKPERVLNFHRDAQPEEIDNPYNRRADEVARALPLELTIRGPEGAVRDFLNASNRSEKYFYVVRSLRVANERLTGPTAEEAKFQETRPAAADPFGGGGFVLPDPEPSPGDEPAEDAPADDGGAPADADLIVPPIVPPPPPPAPAPTAEGERILLQLVGNESIEVFLRIDVLLFHDDVALPEP